MVSQVTICAAGECGGDCYRCRCRQLAHENDLLRQAVKRLVALDIDIIPHAGKWRYRLTPISVWQLFGDYDTEIEAARAAVAKLNEEEARVSKHLLKGRTDAAKEAEN